MSQSSIHSAVMCAPPAADRPIPETTDIFPLSYMQESLWFIEQVAPGNSAYNLPEAWRCRGPLQVAALQRSLDAVAERHEALRTRFGVRDGKPVQFIDSARPFSLHLIDLSVLPDQPDALLRRLELEARRPFDLARGPAARAHLFRLAEDDHVLLLNLHHLVADEWSFGILRRELAALYEACVTGKSCSLPELPIQYADFAVWQRERVANGLLSVDLDFWKHKLRGPLPILELPADQPRPARQSFRGTTGFHSVPRPIADGLKDLGQRHGATLFMTLLAGFQTLLHRYTRQTDLIVGTPFAGRRQIETENLIGFLVNTHALRCDASDDPTFLDFLQRVRETVVEASAHQEVAIDRILEALQPPRDPSRHPLFQAVFGLQNGMAEPWALPGLAVERIDVDNGGAKFDWTLLASETPEGIRLRSEYRTDLMAEGTMARFARHLETLLESIVAQPTSRLSALPMLEELEQRQLIRAWNPTPVDSAPGPCLHEWFAGQVERTPDGIAVSDERGKLTYRELNLRANQLAHYLQALGVGPGTAVALCLERSLDLVVACLGVLKAGGFYVPIDPAVPPARMGFILNDTQARVLLTQESLRPVVAHSANGQFAADLAWPQPTAARPNASSVHGRAPVTVFLDSSRERVGREPVFNPIGVVTPSDTAYVIYTSGSTGQPKGVGVTHHNVVRLLEQTRPWFHFDSSDVWTLFHACTFDFSVWEMWGALLFGGRLVVVPYFVSRSPKDFLTLLVREGVTVLNQTPSAFRQLMWAEAEAATPPRLNLRYVIFGGEALELQSLAPWFERHADEQPRLINMYGITETTVHVTYREIRRGDLVRGVGSVIGVPIPDLRLYLLDSRLQPVPVGVPGEICVGGAGVARGYLNRAELTAQRFVPDPWSPVQGARLYRSGDLARFTSAGELEYLGRIDHQVKIRGFRVELGEIESALNRHPAVRESVVIADEIAGERRLVGYFVAGQEAPGLPELREHLAQLLPDYMIPAALVPMSVMPLTPNGKVDRGALPCPASSDVVRSATRVPPRNETEERIAAIWRRVLGQKSIGINDNFFHLGGHSLLASQVIAQVAQSFNLDLGVRALFEAPTIAGLAEALAQACHQLAAIPRRMPAARARELLARLDSLTDDEIEAFLRDADHQQIST